MNKTKFNEIQETYKRQQYFKRLLLLTGIFVLLVGVYLNFFIEFQLSGFLFISFLGLLTVSLGVWGNKWIDDVNEFIKI